jgi:cytochrome c peroxidase
MTPSILVADDLSKFLRPTEVPYPEDNKPTKQRIELGKLLFFDVRLSKSEKISCASCHDPKKGWSDNTAKAIGHDGRKGNRNTPTVLNGAYQTHQFWDGRAKTLEQQALGPIEADVEMNMPLDELIKKLRGIKSYVKLFEKAYPGEGITKESLAKAIASFERTVVTSDSPFDKYIKGNKKAISDKAIKGFELFRGKAECINCHDGFNFTDGSFQNIGLDDGDLGRKNVINKDVFHGAMKTPTLRDVTKTSPYFHDGSMKDLTEATKMCCQGGKNREAKGISTAMKNVNLSDEEVSLLVEFMKSLESPDIKVNVPKRFPK